MDAAEFLIKKLLFLFKKVEFLLFKLEFSLLKKFKISTTSRYFTFEVGILPKKLKKVLN
jgi:hypothetical protein